MATSSGQYGECMTEEALFELLSQECRVDSNGTVCYYNTQGQLHRVYGPAVVHTSGRHEWYQTGRRHRLDGPAVLAPGGYRAWWQNHQRHRADGPAIEHVDGSCEWYQNGQLHRLDGPAVDRVDGRRAWYINGKSLTEAKWQQAVASMGNV